MFSSSIIFITTSTIDQQHHHLIKPAAKTNASQKIVNRNASRGTMYRCKDQTISAGISATNKTACTHGMGKNISSNYKYKS